MKRTKHLSFEQLRRRYGACASNFDAPAGEQFNIVNYLTHMRQKIHCIEDVLSEIRSYYDDELAAFWCREGVAVSHTSDGWWLLLSLDDCLSGYFEEPISTLSVAECGRC